MSERQVSQVEQLLDMISAPSQLQQAAEVDHLKAISSEKYPVVTDPPDNVDVTYKEVDLSMKQSAEIETDIADPDFIACHESPTDTVTVNDVADTGNRTPNKVNVNDSAMDYDLQILHPEAKCSTTKQESGERGVESEADKFETEISLCVSETDFKHSLEETQNIESTSVIEVGKSSLPSVSIDSSLQTDQVGKEIYSKHDGNAETNDTCTLTEFDLKPRLQELKPQSETGLRKDLTLSERMIVDLRKETRQMQYTDLELYQSMNQLKKDGILGKSDDDVSVPHAGYKLVESNTQGGAEMVKKDSLINETGVDQNLCVQNQYQMNQEPGKTDTTTCIYEEMKLELKKCQEELVSTKSQLARTTRQLEKANSYNEDLRKQVESLSGEIHRYRHRTTTDIDIQVDKEDLMNYVAGMMVMPDWGTTEKTNNTVQVDNMKMEEETPNQTVAGETVSIADSLKATAEAVVLQQSGFVYDETSGLYYDYNTGYYYDNEKSLYYDPNSGTYFYYNHETKEYQFHSQVDVTCYQWQHQSHAPNSSHVQSGGTTQLGENKQPEKQNAIKQPQSVSKEKLKKTERNRKKERKKEKEKDEQSFKNRKERRKALREKIEEKRKKREKTEKKKKKKHHRHKKRKKKEIENVCSSENDDKYVENKMRKRKKKKRKHKREKDKKKDSDKEVIDLEEVDNMQWESETFAKEYNMEEESVLVIDENIKSPMDQICDSQTVYNGTVVNLVQNSNICDENLTTLDAQLGNAGYDKSQKQNKENMDYENHVADKTAVPGENSEKIFEAGIVNDADKSDRLKKDNKIDLDHETNVAEVKDTSDITGEKPVDIIVKSESEVQSQKNLANQDFEENTNTINPKMVTEEKGCFQSCEENDNGLEAIVSKSGNNSDDDTSNIAATESKEELDIIDLKHYDVTEESIGASGSADNSIVISSDSESEMESGELTESESSKTQSDSHDSISSDSSPDSDTEDSDSVELVEEEVDWSRRIELAGGWPPCIRVMVTESNCLSVGTLFIVTCTGATIGREKDMNHAIRIPDISVSKMHAEFQFDSVRGQYKIIDRGSQNGTYINDQRIGGSKEMSLSSPIKHGDVLQLGDTKLLCHIHSGTDTCNWCEPGIVIANHIAKQPQNKITILSKEDKKQQAKQQLKEIKKKYGLKNAAYVDNSAAINNPLYTDKASERRKTVGSDSPEIVRVKAPASVHRPISSENIGHKLLKKMGWSEGESLGKENTGIQEPVTVSLRANQAAGLGSSTGVFSPDDANSFNVKKAARRVQAQQRFNKLQTEGTGNQADKNRSQTDKQWTKGETQYAEGGARGGAG